MACSQKAIPILKEDIRRRQHRWLSTSRGKPRDTMPSIESAGWRLQTPTTPSTLTAPSRQQRQRQCIHRCAGAWYIRSASSSLSELRQENEKKNPILLSYTHSTCLRQNGSNWSRDAFDAGAALFFCVAPPSDSKVKWLKDTYSEIIASFSVTFSIQWLTLNSVRTTTTSLTSTIAIFFASRRRHAG